MSIAKASVQSGISPQNVPKVSAARVIVSQKPTTTQAKSVPGNQLTQESSDEPDIGELEQSEEDYTEIESSELGYGVLEDVETWQETDTEGLETPSSSQDLASSSQDQSSVSRVKTVSLQKKTVTTQSKFILIELVHVCGTYLYGYVCELLVVSFNSYVPTTGRVPGSQFSISVDSVSCAVKGMVKFAYVNLV